MSHIKSAADSLSQSGRVILIQGAKGVGKTTLAVSASKYASDSIPEKTPVDASDVLLIQLDQEGVLGALDAGYSPQVLDLAGLATWRETEKVLAEGLKEIMGMSTKPRFVAVDLGEMDARIRAHVDPQQSTDWEQVRGLGLKVFQSLSALKVTLIGMTHLKAAYSAFESKAEGKAGESVLAGKDAKAIGGERSQLVADLATGFATPWIRNCSLSIARERKRRVDATKKVTFEYLNHCVSGPKFEAATRSMTKLNPVETGSLRSILNKMYGGIV